MLLTAVSSNLFLDPHDTPNVDAAFPFCLGSLLSSGRAIELIEKNHPQFEKNP